MLVQWIEASVTFITELFPDDHILHYGFNVKALIAVILVGLICGAVGSLVVGNRMAFFSDALAHCAFAGVALGCIAALATGAEKNGTFDEIGIPLVMIVFGVAVGLAIAYVRERTALASDTVIGVFFAGAVGFGAILLKSLGQFTSFNPESFLIGNPVNVTAANLAVLLVLVVATLLVLAFMYNQLVFASFNPSLARSRNVPLRLCNYLFIALLALIVNLSIKTVGVLLINGLLIVPAATAANLCRNMRQLFWTTIILSVGSAIAGQWLSSAVSIPLDSRRGNLSLGSGGIILVLGVLIFFVSMVVGPRFRGRSLAS